MIVRREGIGDAFAEGALSLARRFGKATEEYALQVKGLDAVLVGPHDLSCSLGIPEQYEHPRFIEAVDGIIEKAVKNGVGAGVHAFSASLSRQQLRWVRRGANLIVHSADMFAAWEKISEDIDRMRQELGDTITEEI